MGRVADNARWAAVSGVFRTFGTIARLTGDPVGVALSGTEFLRDPYPFYDDVRDSGRIAHGRLIWPTADYRLCREILRDNRFIKAEDGGPDAPMLARIAGARSDPAIAHPLQPPSMLALDPPAHTRFRSLVSKAFTPRAIEQLRPRIQEVSAELLDAAGAGGALDVVHDFAGPLPVTVISEILGIPAGDRAEFRTLGSSLAKMIDLDLSRRDYLDAMSALRQLNAFFDGHIDRVRRDPGDDILSRLVHVEIDGDRLSDHELKATAILLLVAGFETTVNLIGNGTMLLLDNPEQLKLLHDDETLWPNAIEEMLRIDPPVQYTGRVATEDVEIDGVALARKRMVAVLIGGANNDPAMFPDPRRFDVTRDNARDQLAFSAGIHYCIGASLARLEGQIALQTLFTRYPNLESVGQPVRRRTRLLRGYDSIPIRLSTHRPAAV
jgi:hypothetical protein